MNSPTHDNISNALGAHLNATDQFIADNVTDNEIETRLQRLTERNSLTSDLGTDRGDLTHSTDHSRTRAHGDPASRVPLPGLDDGLSPTRTDIRRTSSAMTGTGHRFGIYDELLEIPRGRGMLAHDVAERIGPGLRVACGVTPDDSPAIVRRKVGTRLTEWCSRLPNDLRISVLAALALHPDADHQFMQDRMGWAARRINRDHPRATVRRMKVGFRIIAEQLDDLVNDPRINQSWHISSLRTLLRMDVDPPQLLEERTIVATSDRLEEVELRFSARGNSDGSPITATATYGGDLIASDISAPNHHRFVLRLPSPLQAGEQHEYGIRFTAHPRANMPPFYLLTPLQPCAKVSIRVRFGADIPKQIWRIDGIPARTIDEYKSDDALVDADRFGEVSVEFAQAHQGLSYGIRWSTS